MVTIGKALSKNGNLVSLNNFEQNPMFMLETYAVMKRKVIDGLGKPEPGSQEEKIMVAAIVCQTMIEAGANAHPFYDEEGNLCGFSIDNVNFFLETRKGSMIA